MEIGGHCDAFDNSLLKMTCICDAFDKSLKDGIQLESLAQFAGVFMLVLPEKVCV